MHINEYCHGNTLNISSEINLPNIITGYWSCLRMATGRLLYYCGIYGELKITEFVINVWSWLTTREQLTFEDKILSVFMHAHRMLKKIINLWNFKIN